MRRVTSRGRYLLRGFFAATLGLMWLIAAKGLLALGPAQFIAAFCMIFGVEMVGIGLVRERARRSVL